MKCPYCKIHYMDDERECPMCGKPNPERWTGKQRMEKKYKQSREASDDRKYTSIRHKKTRTTAKPVETATLQGKREQSNKKGSSKVGALISVAVVVISLIPTAISAVGDFVDDLDLSSFSIVETEQTIPENTPAVEADGDYAPPASAYDTLQGEWTGMDTGGYLYFDLDLQDYSYAPDDQSDLEHGYARVYEVDTYDNGDGTTQYGYQVDFYPNWEDYGHSLYLTASSGAADILTSVPYDGEDYLDIDSMIFWTRADAQNA